MSFDSHLTIKALPSVISLKPWKAFDKVWTSVMGYHADKFRLSPGETPMLSLTETVSMIVLYVVVIFGGREFMRNREPLKLNGLFKAHNLFLTLLSGGLLALFIEQLVPTLWNHGLYNAICAEAQGWTPQLVTLYYVSIASFMPSCPAKLTSARSSTISPNTWN